MSRRCAVCDAPDGPDHRLYRLPMALAELELSADAGEWAAAGCVNDAAERRRQTDRKTGTPRPRSRHSRGWIES